MTPILIEFGLILVLLMMNGVLAMTELAVVSARKARLKQLAETGDARARSAYELAQSPMGFLSTVQVGITLVGILAGAVGGATLAEELGRGIGHVAWLRPYAEGIGFSVVVLATTYFSLVLGELVPKRLALQNPEGIARQMAPMMQRLSRLSSPLVRILSVSTEAVLRVLGSRSRPVPGVSEDEVRLLLQEAAEAGAVQPSESEMVQRVLDLDRVTVREIMTPRPKIIWISREEPHETVWHKIVVSQHSWFPVYEGTRDNVVGILSVKAVYANLAAGVPARTADLMTKPLIVPATQTALQLLDTFKHTGKHIALVADEFGAILGLISLHDAMEAIVGDFPSLEERCRPAAVRRADGSWLIDAMLEIEEVERALPGFHCGKGARDFQTLAGFVVKRLGHVPREGEILCEQGYLFEVLDMDRHRVDKVLVMPAPSHAGADSGAQSAPPV